MSQDLESLDEENLVEMKLEQGMLSLVGEVPENQSQTSAHIKSWMDAPRGPIRDPSLENHSVLQTQSKDLAMTAQFEVVQTRIIDNVGQKKHVAYTVMVKTDGEQPDPNPAVIERRYSDFFQLYRSLQKDYPDLMSGVIFPKKVIFGNFAPGVISMRSTSFEIFLKIVTGKERLRESPDFKIFLTGEEKKEIKKWLEAKCYNLAKPLLENTFRLLNKIYTDRHPSVIITLCCLTACCNADPTTLVSAEKYAELALHRFEGVSDIDLLCYYVPLLQLCVHLWWNLGRDKKALEKTLDDLKRCGHKVDGCPTLLDAMVKVL